MWWLRVAIVLTAWIFCLPTGSTADNSNEVAFKLYKGYVIVARGSIGGLRNLNFLVDTGAVPSVLDARVARKLHLQGKPGRVDVPTNTLATQRVTVRNVELGPLHADQLSAIVQDLSFAEDGLGTRVDAMIGFDLLGQSPFTIDYELRRIIFGPIDQSFATVPYSPDLPYAIVDLEVQHEKLRILVDTGASNLVLFQNGVPKCRTAINTIGRETWVSMGGEMPVGKAQLTDAYLGVVSWGQRVAYIPENSANQPSGLEGLLGTVTLGKRVAFDPNRKVVAWELKEP
jgi:Aspartyl protease